MAIFQSNISFGCKDRKHVKTKRHFGINSFNKAHYTVTAVAVKYCSLKGNTNSSGIALHMSKGSNDLEC